MEFTKTNYNAAEQCYYTGSCTVCRLSARSIYLWKEKDELSFFSNSWQILMLVKYTFYTVLFTPFHPSYVSSI